MIGKIADSDKELGNVVFAEYSGIVTDLNIRLTAIYILLCMIKEKYTELFRAVFRNYGYYGYINLGSRNRCAFKLIIYLHFDSYINN